MAPKAGTNARGSWQEPAEWRLRLDDFVAHGLRTGLVAVAAVALTSAVGLVPGIGVALAFAAWPTMATLVLGFAVPALPRRILVEVGAARVAALLAAADALGWRRDPRGGRAALLAQGLLRAPGDHRLEAALDALFADPRLEVTPGVVLAAGIRALAEGRVAHARRLLRFVAEFDSSRCGPLPRRWAADLLAAMAAAEGDLGLVRREIGSPRVPRTRFGELLLACAARAEGEAVTETELRRAWFRAGAGAASWKRVEALLESLPPPRSAPPPSPTPLEGALAATARLYGDAPPPREAIALAAARWDAVLTAPTEIPGGAPGATRVRGEVVAALAERLAACREPAERPPEGAVLREATWQCGADLDQSLSWLSEELGARTDQRRALPLMAEVEAWLALVDGYQAVIDASPHRATSSFAKLYYPAVRHTVWLHNERKQATLANAMYRVELRYAQLVQHDSAVPLLEKNLRCGP